MRRFFRVSAVVALLLFGGGVVLYVRSPIQPVVFNVPVSEGLIGEFEGNERLAVVTRQLENIGIGPEDIVYGPDGNFYTGYQDGRIVRFAAHDGRLLEGSTQEFVNTGGRPLGMQFDGAGNLIVADAFKGLLLVSAVGDITTLVDYADDPSLRFIDDVDVAEDGTIWFSDASGRFGLHDYIYDLVEASATGRLLSYSPATGQTTVHLSNLYFANGVALGPDDQFVLVNETGASRVTRLWLKGEKAGVSDVFIDGLPGMPDNISFNGVDTFWLAMPALRSKEIDALARYPFIRKLLGGLPANLLVPANHIGFVAGLSVSGGVKFNLQSASGVYHTVTSVNEYDGYIWLGSLAMSSVAVLPLSMGKE
ncbi:SMP-30/gluconolactonase/LRE family protein [Zhongshania sp.]|uniref:SMP-30/gluconolactonase/LRE family protein n=1 Tax=Zhongshania sp. TaxID=1971902 RepID=UPI0035655DBB